jgi:hypothetical protein
VACKDSASHRQPTLIAKTLSNGGAEIEQRPVRHRTLRSVSRRHHVSVRAAWSTQAAHRVNRRPRPPVRRDDDPATTNGTWLFSPSILSWTRDGVIIAARQRSLMFSSAQILDG